MEKLVILFVMFVSLSVSAEEVGSVSGRVVDKSSGAAIEFAAAALHDAGTGKMLTGCTTDSAGVFVISGVGMGTYYVECSFVGFKPVRSKVFTVGKSAGADIGTVYLDNGDNTLDEVVVNATRPTFVASLDRKVYNVGQDLAATTGSASDLMQNIPSVDVDMDGNVSLRGNDNVTILVNGKPSARMGTKTRGDALNNLSASSIERIEVITNPSAEYKPDGVSGIINIVMKKGANAGLNGTLSAGAGSAGRYNAGADLNYGFKGFNLFGGYTYRRDRYDRSINDLRTSSTGVIRQDTYGIGRPVSNAVHVGMAADITARDAVEASFSYNNRRFSRNEQLESVTSDPYGAQTDFYSRHRDALAKENMYEGSFHYTHTYGKEREFGVDYTYSSESEDEVNDYATTRTTGSSSNRELVWDANYLHVATLHATHRINDCLKLSAGYEMEFLRAEQNYHLSDWDGTAFIPNTDESSDFAHLRAINSLYVTAEAGLGAWKVLAGLRGEYVSQENKLISEDNTTKRHYSNIYPTLHVSRRLDAKNELMLSYSLRVNRPEGEDMNPFAERINPLSLQSGNPDLMPEKIHSVEAGWQWRGRSASLLATVYYRYLTNEITEVSRYIDNGVLLTTKENMSSSQSAGLEFIFDGSVARWLGFNANLNGFYNQIDATNINVASGTGHERGRHKDAFAWSALVNANVTPFRNFMVQLNLRFRSARLVPQGRRNADSRINLGMKYDIPSINLAVTASVTDLFDTYRKSSTIETADFRQEIDQRRNPRIFSIGLVWKFGGGHTGNDKNKLEYDEGM